MNKIPSQLLQSHAGRKMFVWPSMIGRCMISCISVLLTHSALFLVPLFFSTSPIILQIVLSALVLVVVVGFGGWCRRHIGFRASAPAFVFFNIFFLWGVYIALIRHVISRLVDVVFNAEMILLIFGLYRIILKDPGFVAQESFCLDESDGSSAFGVQTHDKSFMQKRVRYCKSCKIYIEGFDHHCPAFGNCIGQKNYVLFMVLIIGFITTETLYIVCSSQFATKFPVMEEIRLETNPISVIARSTLLFSLLQVLWQVLFLIWHVYCICFNIRTEEWVNWKKYPEFHLSASSFVEENNDEMSFKNPYDKGILQNVKEFLSLK